VLAMIVVLVVWGEWMFLHLRDFAIAAITAMASLGPGA
jgi:flagellar biosynthesis protein FliQ